MEVPVFAKLTGLATVRTKSRFLETFVWTQLSWVQTTREATKLSPAEAEQLITELNTREPGPQYTAERDETGESNQPPYGLDNFVVRKT
jgi:hypothetical protein